MIIPSPATSQLYCIPQKMVLEKIEDKWHVKSIVSREEVFQYMTQLNATVTLHIETWNRRGGAGSACTN